MITSHKLKLALIGNELNQKCRHVPNRKSNNAKSKEEPIPPCWLSFKQHVGYPPDMNLKFFYETTAAALIDNSLSGSNPHGDSSSACCNVDLLPWVHTPSFLLWQHREREDMQKEPTGDAAVCKGLYLCCLWRHWQSEVIPVDFEPDCVCHWSRLIYLTISLNQPGTLRSPAAGI